ncbi:kinase-like protein [Xylaria castorea]|nr:kinase-like protein [Xylaria castorea]
MSTNNRAPNLTLQPAECIPPSTCCSHFPDCQCSTEASRYRILRDLQIESEADLFGSHRRFIPRRHLLRILDRERVANHLATLLDDRKLLDRLSNYTSPGQGETCHCQDSLCTGSRIILASLIRIGREGLIENLHNEPDPRVCDKSLPFSDKNPLPNSFASLNEKEKQLFKHAQSQLRSHYLRKVDLGIQTFEELEELDEEAALPFLLVVKLDIPSAGGLTIIRRIRIDTDHHNLGGNSGDFALKTFQKKSEEADEYSFREEYIANQQTPRHDRIVPVLAAFKHRQEFHFIFPYANGGNLQELWKLYSPSGTLGNRVATWYSPKWLLGECLGIAESLAATHQPIAITEPGIQHVLAPRVHADIKPQNILCFETGEGRHQSFTLKLADFGVSRKVNGSSTVKVKYVTHVKTYRSPEYDLEDVLNVNLDVWCLGCVYLEFLIWAILGWPVLDEFGTTRMNETHDPQASAARGLDWEDTFFRKVARAPRPYDLSGLKPRIEKHTEMISKKTTISQRVFRIGRGTTRISCELKESVKNHINTIRNHEMCTPEFRKFLNFIETRMLVIDANTRASSKDVEIFLRGMTNTQLNGV